MSDHMAHLKDHLDTIVRLREVITRLNEKLPTNGRDWSLRPQGDTLCGEIDTAIAGETEPANKGLNMTKFEEAFELAMYALKEAELDDDEDDDETADRQAASEKGEG
jgi:hypothetical protein